jgi:hypothetical protein
MESRPREEQGERHANRRREFQKQAENLSILTGASDATQHDRPGVCAFFAQRVTRLEADVSSHSENGLHSETVAVGLSASDFANGDRLRPIKEADMSRVVGVVSIALLLAVAFPTLTAAQSKSATGTVSTVSASSVVVKVAGKDMTFAVDAKTVVEMRGAGTADRKAEAAGTPGPKITDLVKPGQNVEVTYTEMGSMNHATRIRSVASVPAEGAMKAPAPPTMTSTGTVTAVAATSLTINASSGPQTYTIDSSTKVVGQGAGTATAAAGGKVAFSDLVGVGDRVSVTYHETGMHATEVRVTAKAKK